MNRGGVWWLSGGCLSLLSMCTQDQVQQKKLVVVGVEAHRENVGATALHVLDAQRLEVEECVLAISISTKSLKIF